MDKLDRIEQINKRLAGWPVQEQFRAAAEMAVEALAVGCRLQRPRRFGARTVGAEDFARIAERVTVDQLAVVINALRAHQDSVKNRIWYMLGIWSKF
jgi:hypothetical protein